jgi:hypothetical protein
MRKRPISRDEIRRGRRGNIITLPLDSVREDDFGQLQPVAKLWTPLLRVLNREQEKRWQDQADQRHALLATDAEQRRVVQAFTGIRLEKPPPIAMPELRPWARATMCRRCGCGFYRSRWENASYCSDRCADAARAVGVAAAVTARSQARAAARADRQCEVCGEPLSAKRATGRFCSVRCRVAAHRRR